MTMRLAILAFAAIGLTTIAAAAPGQLGQHDFGAYPAPAYRGTVHAPAFRGSQRPYAAYRTMIRRSLARGVQFSGRYAVAFIGCGASCRFAYMTDLSTGLVCDMPNGGEEYPGVLYQVRSDSRLLQTQWETSTSNGPPGCALEDFIWTGKSFRSLGVRRQSTCPDWPSAVEATN